jgi:transposase
VDSGCGGNPRPARARASLPEPGPDADRGAEPAVDSRDRGRGVKAVAAYAGLSPRHYESGSIRWPSRIAKTGNSSLRAALYFPAISAMRYNPPLRRLAEWLRERGKSNLTIITAVVRKLLTLAYGVLKSG